MVFPPAPLPSGERSLVSCGLCMLQCYTEAQVYRMPTINPRVNVTLSPSLSDLVGALARHQRVSRSQVLRELLEAAEPALQRVVRMMDAVERAKGAVRGGFAEDLLRAQRTIEQDLESVLSGVDGTTGDLVAMAERIEGRRPARAQPSVVGAPPDPPPSKRGVKSGKRGRARVATGGRS